MILKIGLLAAGSWGMTVEVYNVVMDIRKDGVTTGSWDREAAGMKLKKTRLA